MADLSRTTKRDYIKHPYSCPFCGHRAIEATKLEAEGPEAWQWVRCPDCETQWHDIFQLVNVEEVISGLGL